MVKLLIIIQSYLEYVMYSEEVAEARKKAFQVKQQQKMQLEMHSVRFSYFKCQSVKINTGLI